MPPSSQPSLLVVRLVWAAFMTAVLVYAVVAFVVLSPPSPSAEGKWILLAVAALSGAQLAAAFAFPALITRQAENYLQACIIRWAMLEAVGVYGILLRILGAAPATCGIFMIASLVGLSLLGPSEDGETRFQQEHRL